MFRPTRGKWLGSARLVIHPRRLAAYGCVLVCGTFCRGQTIGKKANRNWEGELADGQDGLGLECLGILAHSPSPTPSHVILDNQAGCSVLPMKTNKRELATGYGQMP